MKPVYVGSLKVLKKTGGEPKSRGINVRFAYEQFVVASQVFGDCFRVSFQSESHPYEI